MSDNEARAYSRGYNAGRKRKLKDISWKDFDNEKNEFWLNIYSSLLPTAMTVTGWTIDGTSVTTSEDRIALAAIWADMALNKALRECKLIRRIQYEDVE